MGNKAAKQERERSEEKREARKAREVILVKVVPPLDRTYVRWLARDLERIYGFAPINPPALEPPDHYIEYMRLNGWLDVDLDDPDLAHLFK
ncbi:Zinc transporter like [Actinidia chinensis var. chinensis]|uniref:Zinc transporter like n=1 Tax=Actinidia chinensis var. chinensis TaxID=1590841 RepID=A0A2R6P7L5_ACTCC|nr:Zinc transporter like [Actinidia chinensis var. chinensis]